MSLVQIRPGPDNFISDLIGWLIIIILPWPCHSHLRKPSYPEYGHLPARLSLIGEESYLNPNTQTGPGCWRGGNRPLERLRHQTPEARDKSRSLDAQSQCLFCSLYWVSDCFQPSSQNNRFPDSYLRNKDKFSLRLWGNQNCQVLQGQPAHLLDVVTFYTNIRIMYIDTTISFVRSKALKVPWHLTYSFFLRPYKFKLWVTQEIILLSSSFFKLSVHHNFLREKELLDETLCYKSQYSSTKVILKTPRKIIDNGKWSQGRNWLLGL